MELLEGKGVGGVRVLPPYFTAFRNWQTLTSICCHCDDEGSSHPRVFLNLSYYAKEHDHSTSCSFCFIVVLSEDSGIFRDTTILRQGMLTKQSMSDSSMK